MVFAWNETICCLDQWQIKGVFRGNLFETLNIFTVSFGDVETMHFTFKHNAARSLS